MQRRCVCGPPADDGQGARVPYSRIVEREKPRAGREKPRAAPGWAGARIHALGHSTRPIDQFLALLQSHGIRTLADVRTVPRSRHNPQFERDALARSLAGAGIRYAHLKQLGGLRRPRSDSKNGAWRNAGFRGYADHMATDEFAAGLDALRDLARDGPVAVMCAEAVPWRCHRSLLADALFARGVVVQHVTGKGASRPHRPTPFAVFDRRSVRYPAAASSSRVTSGRPRSSGRRERSRPRVGGD
jgi:Protein of unknown function, DUF488